jgi:hypothetical protein
MIYIIPSRNKAPRVKGESCQSQRRQISGYTKQNENYVSAMKNDAKDKHCIGFKQGEKPGFVWVIAQVVE